MCREKTDASEGNVDAIKGIGTYPNKSLLFVSFTHASCCYLGSSQRNTRRGHEDGGLLYSKRMSSATTVSLWRDSSYNKQEQLKDEYLIYNTDCRQIENIRASQNGNDRNNKNRCQGAIKTVTTVLKHIAYTVFRRLQLYQYFFSWKIDSNK